VIVNRNPVGHGVERGTSMIETIVVGFTVVLATLPILLTVVRMSEASDVANSEARAIATWVARHGVVPDSDRVGDVSVSIENGSVAVESTVRVQLIGVGGSSVGTSVSASFVMPISPYRSSP
jgi:hypothetical protein